MSDPRLTAFISQFGLDADAEEALQSLVQGTWHPEGGATWSPEQGGAEGTLAMSLDLDGVQADPARTWSGDEPPRSEPAEPAEAGPATHLRILGPLASGGMGEVLRVYDDKLRRAMAMKVLHVPLARNQALRARFLEEAQATAQLEHPGIIPVHELGVLPDGRPFFTMKEVHGRTLAEVIEVLHGRRPPADDEESWTLRRVLELLRRVCDTVGYAHSRGVVHRDLKPLNVMVGAFGEVLVLDWGLVKVGPSDPEGAEAIITERTLDDALATRLGQVSGTPRYMSPEQARGETLDARSDVWSLGAMLYELLRGRPAYPQTRVEEILAAVLAGPPEPLPVGLPSELVEIAAQALSREPAARFVDASALGRALVEWLDGARKREQALAALDEGEALRPREEALRVEAGELQQRAAVLSRSLQSHDPPEQKAQLWEHEDQARELLSEADALRRERVLQLHAALEHDPELVEARDALAEHHRARHAEAESSGRLETAAQELVQLRHYDRGQHAAYLSGEGALTLLTDPPGAELRLHRFVERQRRLEPVFERVLGQTPLVEQSLPMGSWLLTLHASGRELVRYPVHIPRLHHWDGVPPGETEPRPILLPRLGVLGPEDRYVPAGWFTAGQDNAGFQSWPLGPRWVEGFVMRRFPVTNREYIAFLDDLVALGREDDALRWAPQERGRGPDQPGEPCYGRDEQGRFVLVPDADGDRWDPDWPVFLVDWESASAYAAWAAERTGRPWRLPRDLEWEKAARGVDGRLFPWGDHFNPALASVRGSRAGRPMPEPVQAFPTDESVFGLRGMAGGVRDWCAERFQPREELGQPLPEGPGERCVRGGCWFWPEQSSRTETRFQLAQRNRGDTIGFRLARPLDQQDC